MLRGESLLSKLLALVVAFFAASRLIRDSGSLLYFMYTEDVTDDGQCSDCTPSLHVEPGVEIDGC